MPGVFRPDSNRRPSDPSLSSVVITGNFDNWSQSCALAKDPITGEFEAELKLPKKEKIVFKYVLNGTDWVTDPHLQYEHDENGNANNVVYAENLVAVEEFTEEKEVSPFAEPPAKNSSDRTESDSEKLTNVLTSESSYAAVSIPESKDSAFEEVEHCKAPITDVTPTSSNLPHLSSVSTEQVDHGPPRHPQPPFESDVSTLGGNSCNSSLAGRGQQELELLELKRFSKGSVSLKVVSGGDNLMTRLRGLFRS